MAIARVAIPVQTRAPGGTTNAYVVGDDGGLLVDPAARNDRLSRLVEERSVSHIAVTHTHPDHVGGVAHYASTYDLTVWARAGRAERFEQVTGVTPDRLVHEGCRVGPATVVETPGHAPDHVAFVIDDTAVVGDLAVSTGSIVVGAGEGDMRAYLTSLLRLRAMDFDHCLPGHGPVIGDPGATFERLLRHRLDREQRVRQAVHCGARTIEEIVDVAYDADIAGVRDLATDTAAAHLEKLAVEGDVDWDGERARPR